MDEFLEIRRVILQAGERRFRAELELEAARNEFDDAFRRLEELRKRSTPEERRAMTDFLDNLQRKPMTEVLETKANPS